MSSLTLSLFGSFNAHIENSPLSFRSNKERALLAYLALNPQTHTRNHLANLLWSTADKPRRNLRIALHNLRQTIEQHQPNLTDQLFSTTRQEIQFQAHLITCDINQFQQLIQTSKTHHHPQLTHCLACHQHLTTAANLYQPQILTNIILTDTPQFDKWQTAWQNQLQSQFIYTIHTLMNIHFQQGNYQQAIDYAYRQISIEPLQVNVWQKLINALTVNGQRQTALKLYQQYQKITSRQATITPDLTPPTNKPTNHNLTIPIPLLPTPYCGLRPFQEEDAPYFFGRERYTNQLYQSIQTDPFLAVIGASGSGKSSVVQAGLVPKLRSDNWLIYTCRPNRDPITSLAHLVTTNPDQLTDVVADLHHSQGALAHHLVDFLENKPKNQHLLLIIDQFEELFTLTQSHEQQQHFLSLLFTALNALTNLHIIITLRADLINQALNHRNLADSLQKNAIMLSHMTKEEIRQAIIAPAQILNVPYEDGLVERIIRDIGTQPGRLPLVQFALLQLWEQATSTKLDHITYERLGRLEGALAHYADNIYQQLSPQQQQTTRNLFLRLIHPDNRTLDLRHPLYHSELTPHQWETVQHLTNARLLITSRDAAGNNLVDLVHEALIRHWDRLYQWLATNRAFHQWIHHLQIIWQHWHTHHEDNSGLLRGPALNQAESWLETHSNDIPQHLLTFVQQSLDLRQQEKEKQIAQQQREKSYRLAVEAQLALNNDQPNHALALALEANQTNTIADIAPLILSQAAYAPATTHMHQHHQSGILQLAISPDQTILATASADHTIALHHRPTKKLLGRFTTHNHIVTCLDFTADGQHILSGDDHGNLIYWHTHTQEIIQTITTDHGTIHDLSYIPNPDQAPLFLTVGHDHTVRLWHLPNPQPIHLFHGHTDTVYALAISPDGHYALTGGKDHDLLLWNLSERTLQHRFVGIANTLPFTLTPIGHFGHIEQIAFFPDGQQAVSIGRDSVLAIWDIANQTHKVQYQLTNMPLSVAVHPDGTQLCLGRIDSYFIILNPQSGQIKLQIQGHQSRVSAVAFLDQGQTAVSTDMSGEIRYWALTNGAQLANAPYQTPTAFSFILSPDGEHAAVATITGEIHIRNIKTHQIIRQWQAHDDMIFANCSFDSTGQFLVSGSGDNFGQPIDTSVRVWDITTGEQLHKFDGHTDRVQNVTFSPDGQFVISTSNDGTVRYWSLVDDNHHTILDVYPQLAMATAITGSARFLIVGLGRGLSNTPHYEIKIIDIHTGRITQTFPGHDEAISKLLLSPDEKFLLSSGYDKQLRLWDMATGQCRFVLAAHQDVPHSITFNTTGQLAVSGSYDKTIILWDLTTGTPIRRWTGHEHSIFGIAITPDSQQVISISLDRTVRTWRIDATQTELEAWIQQNRYLPPTAAPPPLTTQP
ncbi:MAG TPA: BTAD domain-containing putative transcriptional regulator [Anaerolineae bacterium]|nr:BTAD domain-containing putative transcriptional regulator [Anaerolineae bacterium]